MQGDIAWGPTLRQALCYAPQSFISFNYIMQYLPLLRNEYCYYLHFPDMVRVKRLISK